MKEIKKKQVKEILDILSDGRIKNIFSFIYLLDLKTEKNEIIEFVYHYPLKKVYQDFSERIVIKKSAQVGITLMNLIKMLYCCLKNDMTFIYTLPTADDVQKFSSARFNPLLEKSRIKNVVNVNIDNTELKNIKDSYIYFRGTLTEREAISIPADCIVIDELDFSKSDILEMYEKRLGGSKYKWQWLFSTPTISDYGIDKEYQKSTQNEWMIKCRYCSKEQILNYFENVADDKFICSNCHNEITDEDRLKGRWVAKYPDRDIQGYHITRLIFPFVTAKELKEAEKKAKFKKIFYNSELGECYEEGEVVINREIILRQIRDYGEETTGIDTYIGVDQGDELHYVISKREGEKRKIIKIGICDNFEYIATLMRQYNVRFGIIDALPNKHNAKKLVEEFKGRLKLCYYSDDLKSEEIDLSKDSITVDRTETLDNSAYEWQESKVEIYKLNYQTRELFIKHFQNTKRTLEEDKHGQVKARWVKIGADHFRHADNYNSIAFNMFYISRITKEEYRENIPQDKNLSIRDVKKEMDKILW